MTTKAAIVAEGVRLRQYADDLRARHDKAVDALAAISAGRGTHTESYKKGETDWIECVKKLAGDRLAEICKMPLRKP